jgi:hypothetical protein
MGVPSLTPFSLWVVLFDDAGVFRLGATKCYDSIQIYGIVDGAIASSIAEGSGAADDAGTIYSTVAVSSKPMRVVGRLEWHAGLSSLGAWATDPDDIDLYVAGGKLPGDIVKDATTIVTAGLGSPTTIIPFDGSKPQISEGDQLSTATIIPSSRANLIENEYHIHCTYSAASPIIAALFLNGGADAVISSWGYVPIADAPTTLSLIDRRLAGSVASQQFDLRVGGSAAGTMYVNQTSALGSPLGGTLRFVRTLREIMV